MRRYLLALTPLLLLRAADPPAAIVVSSANPRVGVTADSLASVYGDHIATATAAARSLPWPTSLGDIPSVGIVDSSGHSFTAKLMFVSPSQMNLWIPAGVAIGPATLSFPVTGLPPGVGAAALRNVPFTIAKVAPGLFSLDDGGVAAATGTRVTIPTGVQNPVAVFRCDPGSKCVAVPIDVGVDSPVYLSLYGTGIRGAGTGEVMVKIADTPVKSTYAGPQGTIPGLDQVNVRVPLLLRGSGTVNVIIIVGGIKSNPVKIAIQ
jgi:uncharacterized protein (TIGR03437 family)